MRLVTVATCVAMLALPAAPARADSCTVSGIKPSTITIGLSDVTKKFSPIVDGCSVDSWTILSSDLLLYAYDGAPSETISAWLLKNSYAGRNNVVVTVWDEDYNETEVQRPLILKRRASWYSVQLTKASNTVKLSATLKRADWASESYKGYASQRFAVQFRPSGGSYRTVKTLTTAKGGKISATVKRPGKGSWRLVYGGNSVTGAATSATL